MHGKDADTLSMVSTSPLGLTLSTPLLTQSHALFIEIREKSPQAFSHVQQQDSTHTNT